MKTYSDRGFGQFLRDLQTTYGHRVSVYESSSASGPHLWLDVSGSSHLQGDPVPHAGIPFGVAEGSTTAHMTVEQAAAVRDAIDEWISEQQP